MTRESMNGRLHGFAARGNDQIRFETAAEAYFAEIEKRQEMRLMRPLAVRRQFFGDAGGFVAETFEVGNAT